MEKYDMQKIEYKNLPISMKNMETYGFSWIEFVTAIPAPLFVVTSYKANGKPNACLWSWSCFNGELAFLSGVNKANHMYQTIIERKEAVLNFPSAEIYPLCQKTIINNNYDDDEITMSGLTVEPASTVNAPRIKECFLNLEARFLWEHEMREGSNHVVLCFEILNVCINESHLDEAAQGRYNETGYLYNVHYPVNPEAFNGKAHDYIAIIRKYHDMGEY